MENIGRINIQKPASLAFLQFFQNIIPPFRPRFPIYFPEAIQPFPVCQFYPGIHEALINAYRLTFVHITGTGASLHGSHRCPSEQSRFAAFPHRQQSVVFQKDNPLCRRLPGYLPVPDFPFRHLIVFCAAVSPFPLLHSLFLSSFSLKMYCLNQPIACFKQPLDRLPRAIKKYHHKYTKLHLK